MPVRSVPLRRWFCRSRQPPVIAPSLPEPDVSEPDASDSDSSSSEELDEPRAVDPSDATTSMAQLLHEGKKPRVVERLEQPTVSVDELEHEYKKRDVLSTAIVIGETKIVELILARPELQTMPKYLWNPAIVATMRDQLEILKCLSTHSPALLASIPDACDPPTRSRGSLLHYAARHCARRILPWLLTQSLSVASIDQRGNTPLHVATESGNVQGLALLLSAGASVRATNNSGDSALHVAMKMLDQGDDKIKVVERLLVANAALNVRNKAGKAPADLTDDPTVLELLAQEAAFRSQFPLHCVARANDVTALNAWLTEMTGHEPANASDRILREISRVDKDGKTVVLHAVDALDHSSVADQVLSKLLPYCSRECLAMKDTAGRDALTYLAEKDLAFSTSAGNLSNMALVQSFDAVARATSLMPNFTASGLLFRGATASMSAQSTNLAQLAADDMWAKVASIVAHIKCDGVHDFDSNGYTVLHYCCVKHKPDVLQQVLKNIFLDVEIKTRDADHKTAMMLADEHGALECVRLLLQHGAHHGFTEPYSATRVLEIRERGSPSERLRCDNWELEQLFPAYYLVQLHSIDEARQCIERGETALMLAVTLQGPKSVGLTKCMLQKGADVNLTANDSKTALEIAAHRNKLRVVQILLEHFADLPPMTNGSWPYADRICDVLKKEVAARATSQAYRDHLLTRLVEVPTEAAFQQETFHTVLWCSSELAKALLDDCVSMSRHEATFSNLDIIFGRRSQTSALHTILNIKWELFGRRMYVERLLLHLLLLVTMTISSILFGDEPPSSTSYGIGLTTVLLSAVGYVAAQGLRPRVFLQLSGEPQSNAAFVRWCLAGCTVVVTVTLAALVLRFADELSIERWFATFNNAVLGATTMYFIIHEVHEIKAVGARKYLASPINVVQAVCYAVILGFFVPMKLRWLPASMQAQVGVGALLTLVLWVLSLQFLEVVSSASYLLPMMAHLFGDIWNFFLIFGIFQMGLTLVFYQLFVLNSDAAFRSIGQSFLSTYFVAFGQVPLSSLDAFANTAEMYDVLYMGAALLMMTHSAIMVVVLLNVLLAMMNQTVEGSLANAKTQALISYAQSILRLEGAMNLNEAATTELTHVTDADGKLVLHPIFTERVPTAELSIAPNQVDALVEVTRRRVLWRTQLDGLDTMVAYSMYEFLQGVCHVSRFTELDVATVFDRELRVLQDTRAQITKAIRTARYSRSHFRDQILPKLNKVMTKQLRLCTAQIASLWRRVDATKDLDEHDMCAHLFLLSHHVSVDAALTNMKDAILSELDRIDGWSDNPGEEKWRAMPPLQSKLEVLQTISTSHTNQIGVMTDHMRLVQSELVTLRETATTQTKQIEMLSAHLEAMATHFGAVAKQLGAVHQQGESAGRRNETAQSMAGDDDTDGHQRNMLDA
ncbi:hypothetical protein SDRG_04363 [Saprolegnia diclina VS20]|uniref:Ion transport domain-containing protein n=1 Tax=Saprolegnia diclina (strain VS20) TaxID=1156394 RepID=T0S7H4_SAPDV|nr:hypothetical protein SDRG_04363 [Saprolegnia diclina VS20]EQC38667.1 hypothetical protein SDRG_04363 [Saprolegnia diclina VS20]|eukprot:XP_008608259.1 hypothetical protein SDRG_04363 [Saprolegnia diclina VS20]